MPSQRTFAPHSTTQITILEWFFRYDYFGFQDYPKVGSSSWLLGEQMYGYCSLQENEKREQNSFTLLSYICTLLLRPEMQKFILTEVVQPKIGRPYQYYQCHASSVCQQGYQGYDDTAFVFSSLSFCFLSITWFHFSNFRLSFSIFSCERLLRKPIKPLSC